MLLVLAVGGLGTTKHTWQGQRKFSYRLTVLSCAMIDDESRTALAGDEQPSPLQKHADAKTWLS